MLGVIIVLLLFYMLLLGVLVATYVLNAIGLMRLAKRRVISSPWLAWIPCANYWIIGSIVDEYDERNGFKKRWAKTMLILSIVSTAAISVMSSILTLMYSRFIIEMSVYDSGMTEASIISFVLVIYVIIILLVLVQTVLSVLLTICLYKIYESTVPEKALKYTILTMLVPLAQGFCLLKCSQEGYECVNEEPTVCVDEENIDG